jgi:hypothetical protein
VGKHNLNDELGLGFSDGGDRVFIDAAYVPSEIKVAMRLAEDGTLVNPWDDVKKLADQRRAQYSNYQTRVPAAVGEAIDALRTMPNGPERRALKREVFGFMYGVPGSTFRDMVNASIDRVRISSGIDSWENEGGLIR